MNEFATPFFFAIAFVGGVAYLVFCAYAALIGYSDGELDMKYPSLPQREGDSFEGIRRAIYEIAYRRGVAKFERVKARRIERTGR